LQRLRKGKQKVVLDAAYPDPSPGPSRLVESQLELVRVRRQLQALPETDRAAFVLRVEHGLPYAEIARVLGISLTASKVKVHRVRKRLLTNRVEKEVC
jgi:RNA polymerase sigma-70 factor (ECF subfamily)